MLSMHPSNEDLTRHPLHSFTRVSSAYICFLNVKCKTFSQCFIESICLGIFSPDALPVSLFFFFIPISRKFGNSKQLTLVLHPRLLCTVFQRVKRITLITKFIFITFLCDLVSTCPVVRLQYTRSAQPQYFARGVPMIQTTGIYLTNTAWPLTMGMFAALVDSVNGLKFYTQ